MTKLSIYWLTRHFNSSPLNFYEASCLIPHRMDALTDTTVKQTDMSLCLFVRSCLRWSLTLSDIYGCAELQSTRLSQESVHWPTRGDGTSWRSIRGSGFAELGLHAVVRWTRATRRRTKTTRLSVSEPNSKMLTHCFFIIIIINIFNVA